MKLHIFIIAISFPLTSFSQLYFPPTDGGNDWETLSPEVLDWCPEKIDTLLSFLEDRNSHAFMVLKDGKIVLKEYFGEFESDDIWYWASAAKTITATLTGKAMEDGFLSLDDPVSSYLGYGWTSCDSLEESQRTIFHQLSMSSSFNSSPFLWDCTEPSCFQCTEQAPGDEWHYHNGVYRLLIEVIEEATETDRNPYTDEVLESIVGMSGFWIENLYFSPHRDMARFGLLALNDFVWDGQAILTDQNYIEDLTSPSQEMNPSYGYLWWLNGQESHIFPLDPTSYDGSLIPTGPEDMFMALGANDQKIYVVPSQNLVVTRQGEAAGQTSAAASSFDEDLWALLSDMECLTTNSSEMGKRKGFVFYPNPTPQLVQFPDDSRISHFRVKDISGRNLIEKTPGESARLSSGTYIFQVIFNDGSQDQVRVVVK